jgi:hypothetical protein
MIDLVSLIREDFGVSGHGKWLRSDVHSSLVIDTEKNEFFFNSRGIRGGVVDYLVKIRGMNYKTAREVVNNKTAGNPKECIGSSLQIRFDKLVNLFHLSGKADRTYWYDRKLTDSTIDRYRLGNFEGWNLIPIYDDGYFINFQCRRDKPEKKINFWYKDVDFKPVLYNRNILPFINAVYITEGMVDCILLNQLGLPSVCSTNGALSWNSGWIKYFSRVEKIYYIADNDRAGVAAAIRVSNSLGPYKVRILRFKSEKEKYGALDWFRNGNTRESFLEKIERDGVLGFQKELI